MLIAGFMGMTMLTTLGALMTNYAWREAQHEELRAALRASVAASGPMLPRVTDAGVQERIRERVAGVVGGLVPGLSVSKDDVTISHQPETGVTRVSIGGNARYDYSDLWGESDGDEGVKLPRQTVAVALDVSRYETVIAADLTASMRGTKLASLKAATEVAIGIMEDAAAENTGALLIGMVPFGSAVNVGDTSGTGDTAGKRRYVHMLAGADADDAAAIRSGHWVDMYHSYGAAGSWGGSDLQARTLPVFAATRSWNLRSSANIDLNDEAPGFATWGVDGEDFWNGCVMARWGAYWEPSARPADCVAGCQRSCPASDTTCVECVAGCWSDDMTENSDLWPARMDVEGWTAASTGLTDEPLHLSDQPPSGTSTRFAAYSYPDGRVPATTDARLQGALLETLDPGGLTDMIKVQFAQGGDNNWSFPLGAGNWSCPTNAIQPLIDDAAALRSATAAWTITEAVDIDADTGSHLHLGIVWALRALSPLWRDIWGTEDAAGVGRPLAPCAAGEQGTHCSGFLKKTIVFITDGANNAGKVSRAGFDGRVNYDASYESIGAASTDSLGAASNAKLCQYFRGRSTSFNNASNDDTAAAFNARFSDLAAGDRFGGASLDGVAAAFNKAFETTLSTSGRNTLATLTPWELFRSHGFREDGTSFVADLLDASGGFNFDGRPVYDDMACRLTSSFTPYGRIGDVMQAGGEPVPGVAPFAGIEQNLKSEVVSQLNTWLEDACRIAGERGVEVKIVYLNLEGADASYRQLEVRYQTALKRCITAAGGSTSDDFYEAPNATQLASTFREIFAVTRNLRFLN